MAGAAARRIIRAVALAGFTGCYCLSLAGWEGARFCRLSEDRLFISANSQRFVLTHGGAWELVDPSQKPSLDKWLTQAKLPRDYGQLVAGLPPDHEIPLAGEFDLIQNSDGICTLNFKRGNTVTGPVTLTPGSDGVRLDPNSQSQFEAISKAISKPQSTLLVLMSDRSGDVSAAKAWAAFLTRFRSKSEFFIVLDKKQGVVWARKVADTAAVSPITAQSSSPTSDTAESTSDENAPAKSEKKKSESSDPVPWIIGIVLAVATGVGGFYLGTRGVQPKTKPGSGSPAKFVVSSNERELVEKVRDEIRKLRWDTNHVPSGEEYVVGQMIDRYNSSDGLKKEVETLGKYRQFKEAHDAFQYRIDQVEADAKQSAQKLKEASALLQQERAKSDRLAEEMRLAVNAQSTSANQVKEAKKRISELERKNSEFRSIYIGLLNRTAAVCHDIVLTRPRGDAWALAFAYVVDYTLANLGLALQSDDKRLYAAMLTNLSRLSDAMSKSFPDRKLVIDPWQRAVKAFGIFQAPEYEQKPHPHVDSLSQIVLTLRDTGPSLADFRELYAPSEGGLHIIRPA